MPIADQLCSPQPSPHYQPDSGYIIAWAVVVCSGHHPPRRHSTFSNSQAQIEPHSSQSGSSYINLYLHQTPSRNAWPSPSSWGLVSEIWYLQRPFAAKEGFQTQPHLVVGSPAASQIRRQICYNLHILALVSQSSDYLAFDWTSSNLSPKRKGGSVGPENIQFGTSPSAYPVGENTGGF